MKKIMRSIFLILLILLYGSQTCENCLADFDSPLNPDIDFKCIPNYPDSICDDVGLKFTQYTIGDYISSLKIMRPLKATVLHNSASPAKMDTGLATVQIFKNYHIYHNHWTTIGYHFVISTDGTIYAARKLKYIGAHAGPGNDGTVGVCLVGNLETFDEPTEAQKEAFAALHVALRNRFYGWNKTTIFFHKDFMQTACPGRLTHEQVETWVKRWEDKQKAPQKPIIIFDGKKIGEGLMVNGIAYMQLRNFENSGRKIDWDSKKNEVSISRIR